MIRKSKININDIYYGLCTRQQENELRITEKRDI